MVNSGNKIRKKIITKSLKKGHFKRKKQQKDSKFFREFRYELPSRKTFEASHCSLAFLIVLAFSSIVVLILDVYLFALPVLSTNGFRDTICRVRHYKFNDFIDCKCGGLTNASPYCTSQFPCAHIIVEYNIDAQSASNATLRSIVYQDEAVLQSKNYNCSFASCNKARKQNILELESFKSEFGSPGAIYRCLYNKDNTKQVIITRRYGFTVLVLSLALPCLTFVVSVFFFFIVCKMTAHTQIRQLRIKTNRSYINFGVKLPDGSRTTSPKSSHLPGLNLPTSTLEEDVKKKRKPKKNKHVVE